MRHFVLLVNWWLQLAHLPKELEVQLTDRINRIQISPTAAVLAEAEKLKAKGIDVADFGPGLSHAGPHQESWHSRD